VYSSFADETSKDAKIITTSETILHGLRKYTNYSMQVLAFTSGGDGVKSAPVSCHTEQDGSFFFTLFYTVSKFLTFNVHFITFSSRRAFCCQSFVDEI
jgi:hypothetical protein